MAAIVLKILLGLLQIAPAWLKRYRYTETLQKQAEASRRITHAMNHFLLDHGGDRILLLRANNGSGIPKYGRPHYVTLVDYISRRQWTESSSAWQQVLLDNWYRSMLIELRAKGSLTYSVDQVDSGMLQRVYAKNGVQRIVFLHIVELPKEYWFAVIHLCDGDEESDHDRIVQSLERSRNFLQGIVAKLLKQVTS